MNQSANMSTTSNTQSSASSAAAASSTQGLNGSQSIKSESNQPAKKVRYDSPTANSPSPRNNHHPHHNGSNFNLPNPSLLMQQQQQQQQPASAPSSSSSSSSQTRPLVALLDGRDCSVEMPILKDIATVAFCDAQSTNEIHEKVLNEAQAALLYNTINLSRDDLLKFKALKLIVKIGYNYDNIDVKAAAELNIAVCNVAAYCVEEVADSTLSMILNLYRRTHWLATNVQLKLKTHSSTLAQQQQQQQQIGAHTPEHTRELAHGCVRVRGQNLGIVGLGKIGTAVAVRARAFGFNIYFYDPNVAEGFERSLGIHRCHSINDLVHQSDCISLHASLNETSYHLLNEHSLKSIKPTGLFVVNTANASLIDELHLANGLRSGTIKAAAIDHFNESALSGPGALLRDVPNLMVTPHTAFYSDVSCREMREMAAHEVRRGLLNKIPGQLKNCINKDLLAKVTTPSSCTSSCSPSIGANQPHHHHQQQQQQQQQQQTMSMSMSMPGSVPAANHNQLLAQLSYLKGAGTYEQMFNGMPASSYLPFLTPLAAAAAAAAAAQSSSPSPSPTLGQATANSQSSLQLASSQNHSAAMLSALMDPLKSAQLFAQQHNFMQSEHMIKSADNDSPSSNQH